MPLNEHGEAKVYESREEAGRAALTMLRRLDYSRYGGHRAAVSSFEYGGLIIGDGNTWTYTDPKTSHLRDKIIGLGTADDSAYHSHTNDPLAMMIDNALGIAKYPNPVPYKGNEFPSNDDVKFQYNFILTPTNQMLMFDRAARSLLIRHDWTR